jgi:transposase
LTQLIETLRGELNTLKTDYLTLAESTKVMMVDRDSLKQRVLELEAANKRLTDMLWGRRSERRSDAGLTPLFDLSEDITNSTDDTPAFSSPEVIMARQTAQAAYDQAKLAELEARRKARKERQSKREEFPAHLERRIRVLDLPEEAKQGLKQIGVKITERLRFEKPTVYVEQIQRPQYVNVGEPERGVQSVPPPPSIVESCKYDFSVIAAIIVMKFAFHMPTYREEDYFGQSGWRVSRSTSNDLINYGVTCVDPLFNQIVHFLLRQRIVLGDATTLTVLLPSQLDSKDLGALDTRRANRQIHNGASSSKSPMTSSEQPGSATSYAWLYSGLDAPRELWLPDQLLDADERPPPHESPPDFSEPRWQYAPYNAFHWSLTQQNSVIDAHLANFDGTFVGDSAGVNARLAARSGNRLRHQSCNSHGRRYFVKAQSNDPILAAEMYSLFRQLYAIEYRGALLTSAERLTLRQRDAVPIWQQMARWLERDDVKRVLPKSSLGEAIGYLRNQWSSLRLYLEDGELPFDNNHCERTIRPLTIGRRNWMFLGSMEAAPGRMKLFSVISSAQRHCLSMQDYLEDVLLKLSQAAQHRPQDLELDSPLLLSLLPDRWGALHPQHVHWGRLAERRMVAENKLYYRLQAGLAGNHPYGPAAI